MTAFNLFPLYEASVRTGNVGCTAKETSLTTCTVSLGRLRRQREALATLAGAVKRVLCGPPAFDPAPGERELHVPPAGPRRCLPGDPRGDAASRAAPGVALRFLPMAGDDGSPPREGRAGLSLGFSRGRHVA